MTVGYVGSSAHHTLYNYDATALGQIMGAPQNPLVNSVNTAGSQGKSNNNMLLAGLKHQFSHTFSAELQYAFAHSLDTDSGPYFRDPYLYNTTLPMGGRISTSISRSRPLASGSRLSFAAAHSWIEKIVGGWSVSGIFSVHSAMAGLRSTTRPIRSIAIPATTDSRTCVPNILEELSVTLATAPSKQEATSPIPEQPIRVRTIINLPTITSWFRTIRMRLPTIRDRPQTTSSLRRESSQLLSRSRLP